MLTRSIYTLAGSAVHLIVASLSSVSAQEADSKAALRALVPPPRQTLMQSLSLTCGMGYSGSLGYGFVWEGQKFTGEIARLQRQAGRASLSQRAVLYRRLGTLYAAQGQRAQAQQAFTLSVSLFDRQLKQESGKRRKGIYLAEYALALQRVGQLQQAETQVRAAVTAAPRAWQAWAASGQIRSERARAITAAERPTATGAIPSATVQAAWAEARRDFDTAVRLAPHLPQPYESRSGFRVAFAMAVHPSMANSVAGLPDLERAVALRPRDPYALAVLAWIEYSDYGLRYFPGQNYDNFVVWKVLPDARRQCLLRLRRRIERLAQSPDAGLRARSYAALSWLEYEFHDVPAAQAQNHLRAALRLDPDFSAAEQYLLHTFAVEAQWTAMAQFGDERGQRHPGVRYHLISAYADYKQNRLSLAEEQIRAAIRLKPQDPASNLFLTFLLLRSNNQANVEAAEQFLKAAEAGLAVEAGAVTDGNAATAEYTLLRGFHFALLGKQEEARQQFTHVLATDKENAAAQQGLALLPASK